MTACYVYAIPLITPTRNLKKPLIVLNLILQFLEVLVNLPRLLPELDVHLQATLLSLLLHPLIQFETLPNQSQIPLSHPQERAEIIPTITDIDNLLEGVFTAVGSEVPVEFIAFAHVGETAD